MKEINYLKKYGKISLVAPSFGCTTEPYKTRLDTAIANLMQEGYQIEEGKNIYLALDKVRSNTPKKCAEEFNLAYLKSDSQAIISVGGGEVMSEILPYIDFESIKKAPQKLFMGFSDNTNLTYTLATIAEVPTIYGPCAPSFAFKPFNQSLLDSIAMLKGEKKIYSGYPNWCRYPSKDETNPLAINEYKEKKELRLSPNRHLEMEGRLLGGCLDVLVSLCGTRFDQTKEYLEKYQSDGFVWFLEACDLNPVAIERALFQLKEAGWFKYAKGFVFGRPLSCYGTKMFGINHRNAYRRVLGSLNLPIIMDADLGHFDPTMPIMTGVLAKVSADKDNSFTIEYK
jgi:muramoyltetrapeptide carboxypeptidase LdcA involved in peptidoglycan recycling